MATEKNNKNIVVGGSIIPSSKDTPLDARTRVESLEDVESIQLPYVGMIFFVKSEGKHYVVQSLKPRTLNGINIPDALVDVYTELKADIDLDNLNPVKPSEEEEIKFDDEKEQEEMKNVSQKDYSNLWVILF